MKTSMFFQAWKLPRLLEGSELASQWLSRAISRLAQGQPFSFTKCPENLHTVYTI
jgi:hypothetical protein